MVGTKQSLYVLPGLGVKFSRRGYKIVQILENKFRCLLKWYGDGPIFTK